MISCQQIGKYVWNVKKKRNNVTLTKQYFTSKASFLEESVINTILIDLLRYSLSSELSFLFSYRIFKFLICR